MSSILKTTLSDNIRTKTISESDDKKTDDNDYSDKRDDDELFEVAPERDLREPQPTISVNYRVIKNNGENELKDSNPVSYTHLTLPTILLV